MAQATDWQNGTCTLYAGYLRLPIHTLTQSVLYSLLWLHACASMLRYTYIVSLVSSKFANFGEMIFLVWKWWFMTSTSLVSFYCAEYSEKYLSNICYKLLVLLSQSYSWNINNSQHARRKIVHWLQIKRDVTTKGKSKDRTE